MSDKAPVEGIDFDGFIRAKARIDHAPGAIVEVLASIAVPDEAAWRRIESEWMRRTAVNPRLGKAFELFHAEHTRARRAAPGGTAPAPPPLSARPGPPSAVAPPPPAAVAPPLHPSRAAVAPPPPVAAPPLVFERRPEPGKNKLAGTAMGGSPLLGSAVPFGPAGAPSAPAIRPATGPTAGRKPGAHLGSTAPFLGAPNKPALPFAGAGSASSPPSALPMPLERWVELGAALSQGGDPAPVLQRFGVGPDDWPRVLAAMNAAFEKAPALRTEYARLAHDHRGRMAGDGLPMPLERYASFLGALAQDPARAEALRARYGIPSEDAQRSFGAAFGAAFARDPSLRATFDALLQRARAAGRSR